MKELDLHSKMQIHTYAEQNNLIIKDYIASARNGHVFETECGVAIKYTTDLMEVHNSLRLQMVGFDKSVEYHDFHRVSSGEYIIKMELLDTDGIEEMFDELEPILDDFERGFLDCDSEGYEISSVAEDMLNDLKLAVSEAKDFKIRLTDIHEGNIERTPTCKFKIFDNVH